MSKRYSNKNEAAEAAPAKIARDEHASDVKTPVMVAVEDSRPVTSLDDDQPTESESKPVAVIREIPPAQFCDVTLRVVGHDDWGAIRCSRVAIWQACFNHKHKLGHDQPMPMLDGLHDKDEAVVWIQKDLFRDATEFQDVILFLFDVPNNLGLRPIIPDRRSRIERLETQLNHLGSHAALERLLAETWHDIKERNGKSNRKVIAHRCSKYRRPTEISDMAHQAARRPWDIAEVPKVLLKDAAKVWLRDAHKLYRLREYADTYTVPTLPEGAEVNVISAMMHYKQELDRMIEVVKGGSVPLQDLPKSDDESEPESSESETD
jgi:hypothetical protein